MSLQISAPCQLYRANGPVMWCTSLNRKVTSHQSPLTPQIKKHTFMSRSTDSIKQERLVLILPPLQQEDHVPRISACTSVCQRMSRPMMRPGPTREDTHTHTHLTFSQSVWHLQGQCEGARTANLHNDRSPLHCH